VPSAKYRYVYDSSPKLCTETCSNGIFGSRVDTDIEATVIYAFLRL